MLNRFLSLVGYYALRTALLYALILLTIKGLTYLGWLVKYLPNLSDAGPFKAAAILLGFGIAITLTWRLLDLVERTIANVLLLRIFKVRIGDRSRFNFPIFVKA